MRGEWAPFPPGSGGASIAETGRSQNPPTVGASPEDAVNVQWDSEDQIMIYRFVNQQGSLILQMPSQ